ncbi:hypothetical protein F5Y01DRAFT_90069 [Xylaria sp. FL0043]|nr:hypothetical protein F5Y01DRAFT_90069 [Xylaria sp. FL0043]
MCLSCLSCLPVLLALSSNVARSLSYKTACVRRCLSKYSLTPTTRIHPSFLDSSCSFLFQYAGISFLIARIPSPDSLPVLFFSYDPISSSSRPGPIAHNGVGPGPGHGNRQCTTSIIPRSIWPT